MTEARPPPSRTSIVVDAPDATAFAVFTEGHGQLVATRAPHHPGTARVHGLRAPAGGHVYDVGTDGSECRWARVLAYDPPNRVVFSWDISLPWQLETDPSKTSEVEVRFVAEGEHRTRVELEHRHLDRHGEGWEGMRDAVRSGGGWGMLLQRFAHRLEGAPVGDA